ncbi:MAG TPA: general secretion pathway protein GspB [Xanthomonadaceae bacterium]|nr:general secretion pathway protein GspB [Xanthomonadaceae bacterium]
MSLILEALKKSEAERQKRQMPGLLTPGLAPRRRRGSLWLGASMLLLAAVGGGWWLGQQSGGAALTAHTEMRAESPAVEETSTADADTRHVVPDETPPATDATLRRQPASPSTQPARMPARPAEREGAPLVAPSAPDPLADPDLDDHTRARLTDMLATVPDPPRETVRPSPPPTTRQVVSALTPVPPDTGTPGQHDAPGTPLLHELPYTLRRDIPPIRVSMMVSSGDAGARFALINGERRSEGDEVAPGVRLLGIAPQTLELEFRGQRFLLRQGAL